MPRFLFYFITRSENRTPIFLNFHYPISLWFFIVFCCYSVASIFVYLLGRCKYVSIVDIFYFSIARTKNKASLLLISISYISLVCYHFLLLYCSIYFFLLFYFWCKHVPVVVIFILLHEPKTEHHISKSLEFCCNNFFGNGHFLACFTT